MGSETFSFRYWGHAGELNGYALTSRLTKLELPPAVASFNVRANWPAAVSVRNCSAADWFGRPFHLSQVYSQFGRLKPPKPQTTSVHAKAKASLQPIFFPSAFDLGR